MPLASDRQVWTRALRVLGVSPSTASVFCEYVQSLYERLSVRYPQLDPTDVFKAVVAGLFAATPPFLSTDVVEHVFECGEAGRQELSQVLALEFGRVFSSAKGLMERADRALIAREELSNQLQGVLGILQIQLAQQQEVLRVNYPFSGNDSLSAEVLGQRVFSESADAFLPQVYRGLDEVVSVLRNAGLWVPAWDGFMGSQHDLAQTQSFMNQVGRLVGALDDTDRNKRVMRTYTNRWAKLDPRLLAALESRFSWTPELTSGFVPAA